MTREELLEKAIYIQYPLTYTVYKNYGVNSINKLPLAETGMMYDNWNKNDNHFTTEYHRLESIPFLCRLLNLPYNEFDFEIDKRISSSGFDISILKPKCDFRYEVFGYNRNEHFDNLTFNEITHNDSKNGDITDFHRLYKYSHECSRLINKTVDSERILFISGDSQMIPDVSFLSCFFKEVWYFDNRNHLHLNQKWKDVNFTDVVIEMNCSSLSLYQCVNFE